MTLATSTRTIPVVVDVASVVAATTSRMTSPHLLVMGPNHLNCVQEEVRRSSFKVATE